MGKIKTIIVAIDDKIDKVINDLNDEQYDGMSNYYYCLREDMPHIVSGLYFCVKLLNETKTLTDAQAEYFNEKISEIKY